MMPPMLPRLGALFEFLARAGLAGIFLYAGWNKWIDLDGTAMSIEKHGLPMPTMLAVLVGTFEMLGGLLLFFGVQVRLGAVLLLAVLVPATWFYHPPDSDIQAFLMNCAIGGGLLLVLRHGTGPMALQD